MMLRAGPILLVLLVATPPVTLGAAQIGLRGGYAHAEGELSGGDLGGSGIYGLVAAIGLTAAVDVEFAFERYTEEFSLDHAAAGDALFGGEGAYEDQAYLFTGKLHLPLGAGPLSLVGGAGGSIHSMDLRVTFAGGSTGSPGDAIEERIGGDGNEWEWHLTGGLQLRVPSMPLLAYAEFRYQDMTGNRGPSYSSAYAGLNVYLD